jgi:16S rRNA (adenine1518-N6/adenine1519-N6)-dimethyltransferase
MQSLKEIIQTLRAKKSLGQNFLMDPNILQRIVKEAKPFDDRTVIEVGPGPGGLTREIIKYPCRQVFLIEQDSRCIPHLEALRAHFHGELTIVNGNALELPLHTFGCAPRRIIANLPYNISVPLLLQWLKHLDDFESLTLMFQKEVAARLMAAPDTPDYGRLSVMCQWRANIKKLFDLPPGAFLPSPKVSSTVVHLTPRQSREDVPWEALEKVTKAAFSQRRKMLRSSLKRLFPAPQIFLEKAKINPERRAENLSIKEFCTLAAVWETELAMEDLRNAP